MAFVSRSRSHRGDEQEGDGIRDSFPGLGDCLNIVQASEVIAETDLFHWLVVVQGSFHAIEQNLGESLIHNKKQAYRSVVHNVRFMMVLLEQQHCPSLLPHIPNPSKTEVLSGNVGTKFMVEGGL